MERDQNQTTANSIVRHLGAGTRGHVATRMTLEEFLAAKVNENGRVVFVEDHKTS